MMSAGMDPAAGASDGVNAPPTRRQGPRLATNAVWLGAAQVATVALSLGLTIAISRWLGTASLGQWRLAQAIVSYLLVVADAGLSSLAIREIARNPSKTSAYGTPIVALQVAVATVLFFSLAVVLALVALPTDMWLLTMLLAAVAFPQALSLGHVLQGREAMSVVARLRVAMQLASTVGGIVLLAITGSLVWVSPPILLSTFIAAGVTFAYVRHRFDIAIRLPTRPEVGLLARGAAPFLVAALAVQVILNADALLIGALSGVTDLGLYAAAYAIAAQMLALGGPLMTAAFPRLSSSGADARLDLLRRLCSFLGYFIFPAAIGLALISDLFIDLLYGSAYVASGPVLAILVALPLFGYYNMAVGQTLGASRHQRSVMVVSLMTAGINIGLNLLLIPRLGITGAAITVVASELATAAAFSILLRRHLSGQVVTTYFENLPSVAIMSITLIVLRAAGIDQLLVLIFVGATVFVLSSLALPSFARSFLRDLIASRRGRRSSGGTP